jgi:hypothetical protein
VLAILFSCSFALQGTFCTKGGSSPVVRPCNYELLPNEMLTVYILHP